MAEPAGQAAAWAVRAGWLAWALALLGAALTGLDQGPLLDVDEGAFAEASREMLASGDWGHTTLNGADRFDKPIGVYWLQAASLAVFGTSEWAVRLPSALCAWLWALATAAFVRPRWGCASAVAAGTVIATALGPSLIGRAATADALLNLLLALTLFDLWRALASTRRGSASGPMRPPDHAEPAGGRPLQAPPPALSARLGLWMGLGLLTKGPVAVALPMGALALWALGGGRPAWHRVRAVLQQPLTWAVLLAVALPWYAYALQRHGPAFVDGFWLRHNLQRFHGPLEGHGGGPAYHLALLPLLLWPWAPLLWPVLRRWRATWQDEDTRWLLAWSGFTLAFFSLAGTKLPHYGLYGITPLAVLIGRWLGRAGTVALRAAVAVVVVGAGGLAAAVAASPTLAVWAARHWGDALWPSRLAPQALPPPTWLADSAARAWRWVEAGPVAPDAAPLAAGLAAALVIVSAAALAAALVAAWAACQGACPRATAPICTALAAQAPGQPRPQRRAATVAPLVAALCGASLAGMLWTSLAWLPWWAQALQQPVKDLATLARANGWPLVQWQVHQPSAGFYRGAPVPRRPPADGEVALVALAGGPGQPVPALPDGTALVARRWGWALVRPHAASTPP